MHASRRWLSLSLTVCLLVFGLGAHELHASTSYFIHLQAQSGHYVVGESGGNDLLYADRTSAGAWETFEIVDLWDGDGALMTGDEVFIRMFSGGRDVIATVTGPWNSCGGSTLHTYPSGPLNCRKFYIYKVDNDGNVLWDVPIENGDQVAIYTYDGFLWSADGGGGGNLTADRSSIGPWEKFFITILGKP